MRIRTEFVLRERGRQNLLVLNVNLCYTIEMFFHLGPGVKYVYARRGPLT